MGVDIRTIVSDNVATRCDGCNEIIEGTPWRVNVLDIVATESPVDWTETLVNGTVPVPWRSRPRARVDGSQGLPVLSSQRGA